MSQPAITTLIGTTPIAAGQSAHVCSLCLAPLESGRHRSFAAKAAAGQMTGPRFIYLEPLVPLSYRDESGEFNEEDKTAGVC